MVHKRPAALKTSGGSFEWPGLAEQVLAMERAGVVTRTFRRLDPERQTAVIQAILDDSADSGPTQINIKRVAKSAGVSVGSLYQYFGDRAGMLDFAVRLGERYMREVVGQGVSLIEDLPLSEALFAYVSGGCDWAAQQPSLMRFFARAAYREDGDLSERFVRPVAIAMRENTQAILEAAAARGEVPKDLDFEMVAGVVHALTVVLCDAQLVPSLDAYFQIRAGDLGAERVLRGTIALIVAGLRGMPPSGGARQRGSRRARIGPGR